MLIGWIALLEVWIGDPGKSAAQFRLPFGGWLDPATEPGAVVAAALLTIGSLWAARRLWDTDRSWALILVFDAAVLICVDRAVLFNPLNLAGVVPWVVRMVVMVLTAGDRSTGSIAGCNSGLARTEPSELSGAHDGIDQGAAARGRGA